MWEVGCPCQFNARPTHGHCRAAAGYRIEKGRFGDTSLDGVTFVGLWAWPGAIHEGRGEGQLIVDEHASEAHGEPIRNPVTGDPHRARVTLPHGFEYHEAEYASSRTATQSESPIALDWTNTHGHFARLSWTRSGPVHPQ